MLHGLAGQLGRTGWQAWLVGRHMQVGWRAGWDSGQGEVAGRLGCLIRCNRRKGGVEGRVVGGQWIF